MSKFIIMADSLCDLDEQYLSEYDIEMMPGHVNLPDGTELTLNAEWDCFETMEKFYAALSKNPDGYATSPANVAECEEMFKKYASQGIPVMAITISSGISGAYNSKLMAKENVLKEYPDARIDVVDSLRFGPGFGLLVVHAAMLRKEGKDIDEVLKYVEENKNRFHQTGWLDDLSFVAKKGRVTHAKAFFGTLAGVKPLGEFDYNGLTTVIGKAKGAKAAYKVLLEYMDKMIENPEDQVIFIAQSNRYAQAVEYKKMIEERFHPKAVYINPLYPLNGINVGPGLMACYYVGKPISEGLVEEKALMESLINP